MQCTQSGCDGSILDGYCDVCGTAAPRGTLGEVSAVKPATVAPSTGVAGDRGASVSTRTLLTSSSAASYRLASAPLGAARSSGGSAPTRRLGTAQRNRAPRLGAGLTTVPSTPVVDPRSAVMAVPEVKESQRNCSACGAEVGRGRNGNKGRTEGFCAQCRAPFSFTPKLAPGDLVGGQYEVVGCLAHGGLGWIYLARDKNVSDRYVVLKGLLNSGDADAFAAAIAERQFLAEVEQPLIVEIYNFVSHDGAGYTVMEYVGGKSLKGILKDRMQANGGAYDPIPVDQAIAYVIEILPAFSYLHASGLIYCDFKPDNVIQQGDNLKLIDLGGVRRIDDQDSAIYGTVGFQAPEIAQMGPSIAGDIFTIGRTLAVLAMEFRGYQSTYVSTLPPPDSTPLFQEHDSLYRVLCKATAANPDDRFQSADELRDQLIGVLREIVAVRATTTVSHSTASAVFEAPAIAGASLTWRELPQLRVDTADALAGWLAGISVSDPTARLAALDEAQERSPELLLARARAAIECSDYTRAQREIDALLADDPWEWRAIWLAGLLSLATDDLAGAVASFNAVYGQVPGELAPKLALALACERRGDTASAIGFYSVCARCDANYAAPAAFGLARVYATTGANADALGALDLVPSVSRSYIDARTRRAEMLIESNSLAALAAALQTINSVSIDVIERNRLVVSIYDRALRHVLATGESKVTIGNLAATEADMRRGLEAAYRDLAAVTEDRDQRVELVDHANRVRPRSLV